MTSFKRLHARTEDHAAKGVNANSDMPNENLFVYDSSLILGRPMADQICDRTVYQQIDNRTIYQPIGTGPLSIPRGQRRPPLPSCPPAPRREVASAQSLPRPPARMTRCNRADQHSAAESCYPIDHRSSDEAT